MPHLKLTIQTELYVGGDSEPEDIQEHLRRIVHDYSDGRYPLSVELLHHGIEQVVAQSVRSALGNPLRLRNEALVHGGYHLECTARWKKDGDT